MSNPARCRQRMSHQITQPKPPPHFTSLIYSFKSLLLRPLSLIVTHCPLFFVIFLFLTLPLSILLSSLSSRSHQLKLHVLQLHSLASLSPTRFEARQVWKESREDAVSFIHLKLVYSIPCFFLSLAAAVTTVSCTVAGYKDRLVTVGLAFAAVKFNWLSPLVTSICSYFVLVAYSGVPRVLAAIVGNGLPGSVVRVVGLVVELYVMSVIGVAMVVSIVEERAGWDALRVGSCLMAGKRASGSLLAGLLTMATASIRWRMEVLLDDEGAFWDRVSGWSVVESQTNGRQWEWTGLVVLYGLVVVWGYVVSTVFYCECKKQNVSEDAGVDGLEL